MSYQPWLNREAVEEWEVWEKQNRTSSVEYEGSRQSES